jgi:catechol 2,3-dioxygenase-like lactoylglutathione lyase family enzyme
MQDCPRACHHTAYVSKDLEATRKFYEEIIGLPLLATWCEKDMLFGAERTYAHCFFGLGDGGALAFFQFADSATRSSSARRCRSRRSTTSR